MILQADNFNNGSKYLIHIKKLYLAKRQKNAYAIKGIKKYSWHKLPGKGRNCQKTE